MIEAFDRNGTRTWRRAHIVKDEPYYVRGRLIAAGAYINWADLTPEDYHNGASIGGWVPRTDIRPIEEGHA